MHKDKSLDYSPYLDMNIRLIQEEDCPRVPEMVYIIVYRCTLKKIARDAIQRIYVILCMSLLSLVVYMITQSLLLTGAVTISLPALLYVYFAHRVCDKEYYSGEDTRPGVDFFKYWSDNDAGHFLWVAEHDGNVIGSAAVRNLSDKCGEVLRVVTHPDYQGKKVAERLMHRLIENCKSRGLDELILYTSYKQVPAQKLYIKFGFNMIEQIQFGPSLLEITGLKFHLNL